MPVTADNWAHGRQWLDHVISLSDIARKRENSFDESPYFIFFILFFVAYFYMMGANRMNHNNMVPPNPFPTSASNRISFLFLVQFSHPRYWELF